MNSEPADFASLTVAAFESRRAGDMQRLIERHGGRPLVAPSMREVPVEDSQQAVDCVHRLLTGEIDAMIFLTGVGFQLLLEIADRYVDRQRYLDTLSDVVTICRGPKPTAAMKQVGLKPTYRVPEPNTWRELLATIDEHFPVTNLHLGLQEYGRTNPSLIAGLEARGARVHRIPVYRWDLPEDVAPLQAAARSAARGEVDALMFTSANQVENLFAVAADLGCDEELRQSLKRSVVASIGPTTSEALRREGLSVDLEASPPKMGVLVKSLSEQAHQLLGRKRRIHTLLSQPGADPQDRTAAWYDSPFMKACRREPTNVTPVWLMRQAGRYMAEYRAVRKKVSFLELCKNPQLCSEVMCTAVKRLGVDAAIIFSDLLPILEPMGLELEFPQGEGPVIHNPVREAEDVDNVLELESMESLGFVVETVQQTRRDLPAEIPLIGFAGAPFTLASYAIEGGASRNYVHTKTLMYRDEGAWRELMERLARAVTVYLNAQVRGGAQAVQLFDSWVGCLGPDDYRQFVLPYVKSIVQGVEGAPVINFATGNPALLPLLAEAEPAVVGVDWRIRLDAAWETVGASYGVQGNLDPLALMAELPELRRRTADVLQQAKGRPGHIFNLGHGVLPQTNVNHAKALVDMVHELSAR